MGIIRLLPDDPLLFAMLAVAIIAALIFHELAHAFVAYRLGDTSQRERGRLTLNPIKHIDPIGGLMLLFVGFGWAKPVMVDPRAFKSPKRGMGLTALAGPVTNFLLALIGAIIFVIWMGPEDTNTLLGFLEFRRFPTALMSQGHLFLFYFIQINVGLGIFNLIPIPPLDGSKILASFLPDRLYEKFLQAQTIMALALLVLMFTGAFDFLGRFILSMMIWIIDVGLIIVGWFA